jgi:hypothetical protein
MGFQPGAEDFPGPRAAALLGVVLPARGGWVALALCCPGLRM